MVDLRMNENWKTTLATMKFEAVLFDLDGTLLDTLGDLADATNRVLADHGCPTHPLDAYRFFVGDGMDKLVFRALPEDRRTASEVGRYLEILKADYGRNMMNRTRPYDGIPELLAGLSRRGLRLAVLSNKTEEFTLPLVEHYFPGSTFEQVVGSREGVPKKPDPTAAAAISRAMNLAPARFLYLGDTGIDMRTATSAGMFAVGVAWGFRPREELLANGARLILERPQDLLALLESSG